MTGAGAQTRTPLPRIALTTAPPLPNVFVQQFREGMWDLGYVDGQNVVLDFYSVDGRAERFPEIIARIVRTHPAVIVTGGGTPAARAAMQATRSIPIVVPAIVDPVGDGLVRSLARPGGNLTGFSIVGPELSAKRIELLRELVPGARRIALFRDPVLRAGIDQISPSESAARRLSMHVMVLGPSKPEEYETYYDIVKSAGARGLIVLPSSSFNANRQRLIELSSKYRLPTVWEHEQFPLSGGLVSYGPNIGELYRGASRYVDRILKGAKPAELPVETPQKLELVINLKTARAQGVSVPANVLAKAARVIE